MRSHRLTIRQPIRISIKEASLCQQIHSRSGSFLWLFVSVPDRWGKISDDGSVVLLDERATSSHPSLRPPLEEANQICKRYEGVFEPQDH